MTQPLLVILPCHQGDVAQSETLLRWIKELGNVSEHSLMIAADAEVPQEKVKALLDIVRGEFHSVRAMIVNTGVKGWPQAANLVFRAVARQVNEFYKAQWLWLEPDTVPLRASWLNDIAEEYTRCPKLFMGCILDAERPIEGLPNKYMSGVAVYPTNTYELLTDLWKDARFTAPSNPKLSMEQRQANVRAFDMLAANFIVPRAHHTPLIQHFWGTSYSTPPIFKAARTEADPMNTVTLDMVKSDAVLFHRCKDIEGFLALLRIRLEAKKPQFAEPGLLTMPPGPKRKGNPNWVKKQQPEMASV